MSINTVVRRATLFGAVMSTLISAPVAVAHHGWGAYDTGQPLYIEGTVAEVQWRNPHPELVLEVSTPLGNAGSVPVLPELEQLGFRDVLASAQPAPTGRYTLDLAPIGRLENWGLQSPPETGERMTAIAFPSCSEAGVVRPALIVLADGTPVRQQSVRLPEGCSGEPRG